MNGDLLAVDMDADGDDIIFNERGFFSRGGDWMPLWSSSALVLITVRMGE
jgi:hypothetical protein